MSRNIFIIHGAYGHPEENWFPWLKKELELSGCDVFIPEFPTPKNQTLKNWINTFDSYKKYLNENSIVVGHSLGCSFILNYLNKNEVKIDACFLVAPFISKIGNESYDSINKTFLNKNLDWNKVKEHCRNFFIYASDNDPYIPLKNAEEISGNLSVRLKIIKNAGHFNEKAGYTKFEILLKDINKITAKDL